MTKPCLSKEKKELKKKKGLRNIGLEYSGQYQPNQEKYLSGGSETQASKIFCLWNILEQRPGGETIKNNQIFSVYPFDNL